MRPYPKLSENCNYALAATRDRLHQNLCCKLGPMDPIFIDARVKINGTYYREVLLTQKLPSVMREICGKFFIFQQSNVPAHRMQETINLLRRDTCVHFTRPSAT